jgi:transcriptional regulator with XRE-family HTH domain/cytidylate kinase
MIKNERQYKITKAEAQRFEVELRRRESEPVSSDLHPLLVQAELDGLRSQFEELQQELAEYEALRSGQGAVAEVTSIQEIPQRLIQARIRSGMTQEDLAAKIKMKPQQLQRYEATDYSAANLSRIAEIADVLQVSLGGEVPDHTKFPLPGMLKRLKSVGLSPEFVTSRLLPASPAISTFERRSSGELVLEAAQGIERVYGWTPAALYGTAPLDVSRLSASVARFKVPARVNALELGAYVVYAHYLALLVLQATKNLAVKTLSTDPVVVRKSILSGYGELSFQSALRFLWDSGIPVLTLNDPGTFHGACWRSAGRNVVVLKQQTRSAARWMHDLLHEYFHAASNPDLEDYPVIEESETSEARRKSPEEIAASSFAGNVMLDGRAEELAALCVDSAKGSVERLKTAVQRVADREAIDVGALANYMAFRLSQQGINWWAAATNLQSPISDSRCTPREMLLKNADLTSLNPVDRGILLRSLEPQVIAFSGRRASGKSTVSSEVAKALEWKWASFGTYLRAAAKHEGVSDSTENLQELGAMFVKQPDRFCREVLSYSGWQAGEPLIIEGVRHREVMESLRKIVAPLEARLVFLDVEEAERMRRLEEREQSSEERTKAVEEHSTEKQVKEILPAEADFRIGTDQEPEAVVRKIIEWIHAGPTLTTGCQN